MLTILRQEALRGLVQLALQRPAALRRSTVPGFLLATDLPVFAPEMAGEYTKQMTSQGWTVTLLRGWLFLDRELPVPRTPPMEAGGELGCCISLLERHQGGSMADRQLIRDLALSEEAGEIQVERFAMRLHGELAERLRLHQPLPDGLLPYLYHCAAKRAERG